MEPYSWEMVGERFPSLRAVVRALRQIRRIRRFDFLLLSSKDQAVVAVCYDVRRHPGAPLLRIFPPPARVEEFRLAAALLRIPVLSSPGLVGRVLDGSGKGQSPWPGCREGVSAALARLHRKHPGRYGRKWGIGKVRGRVPRMLSRRWMIREVAGADFVITGKDGCAVAVRYEVGCMAPKVLALGQGVLGKMILAQAQEHGLPSVEDVPCADRYLAEVRLYAFVPEKLWDETIRLMSELARANRKLVKKWKALRGEDFEEGEEWKG